MLSSPLNKKSSFSSIGFISKAFISRLFVAPRAALVPTYRKTRSLVLLFAIVTVLSACRSTVKTIEEDNNQLIRNKVEKGYLLIGVETSHSLRNINIGGPRSIRLSHKDLRGGTNFILVPLDAGIYKVEDVGFSQYMSAKLRDEDDWSFTIKAQTISYVGHLEISSRSQFAKYLSIELVNRSTEAIDFITVNFPSIYKTQALYYGGPGEDDYFDFIKTLGE